VGTVKVRGRDILLHRSAGLQLWAKASSRDAKLRFTLQAHAFSTNQVTSVHPKEFPVSTKWEKIEVGFAAFPKIPLTEVDFLMIEAIAEGPEEVLIDDLQYLGNWDAY
jgi:hypothetical protein